MNRKKFYILTACLGLAIGCYAQPIAEMDTLYAAQKEVKTFKVRKLESSEVSTMMTLQDALEKNDTILEKPNLTDENVQRPSLAYDEKGLMQLVHLAPFPETGVTPKDTKYVIFSFSVDEKGAVSDIRIFDTNDMRLVDLLVIKLSGTFWNPAKTTSGTVTNYSFGRWIAAVPKNANEMDYDRHRY